MKCKVFLVIALTALTSCLYSCVERRSSEIKKPSLVEKSFSEEQALNEIKFKQWLKDTLITLKLQKSDEYKRLIKVSVDSLSMDIKDSYSLIIDKNYDGENKELLYALDLLDRNGLTPTGKFNLEFIIVCYYSISMVEQMSYEFDSEVIKFEVDNNNQITKYKFVKGNLIDKTTTFKK